MFNPLLMIDFYKSTHHEQYPVGLTKMVSYYTPRMSRLKDVDKVTLFGLQAFIKEYLIEGFNDNFFNRPEDGLSGKTDEDNLGFTYDELDNFLLQGHYPSYDVYKNIEERHKRNLHKINPMPSCPRYYSTCDYVV